MTQEKPKTQEILRLIRNAHTGEQTIQIAGRSFDSIAEVPHPKAQQIILTAVGNLVAFAGGYDELVAAGVSPPLASTQIETDTPMESFLDQFTETEAPPQQPTPPSSPTPPPPPADLLGTLRQENLSKVEDKPAKRVSFWGNLRGGRPKPKPVEPLPLLNLGQQLNLIVQKKLKEEPQLQGRRISISNDDFGGIEINIDGRKHDDVAQVDDPLARMLIKLAITEWEEGQSR